MVAIRPADQSDLDAVRRVAESAWYAAYGGILEPATIEQALVEWYDEDLLAAAAAAAEITFLVAAEDDRVVGFASAEQTWADEMELHTLYVEPDEWGRGVGSTLLEAVIERARETGVDRLACGVLAANVVGVAFFESRGFERGEAVEIGIFGERHTEYEYRYEL